MNFGKVEHPEKIDFNLPSDHKETQRVLKRGKHPLEMYVGCAKWNKTDLKNFYPRGTKDELAYYSTQFNSVELNATFYGMPTAEQVRVWKEKTPESFKFFPKITNTVSHFKRLKEVKAKVEEFCNAIASFEHKLGMVFLQMRDDFKPKDFSRLEKFVLEFPKGIPLAVEVRSAEWFKDPEASNEYYRLLEDNNVCNVIVDTAGRRDILHMRLTNPTAFVRYVGANHSTDYTRLEEWVERIKKWKKYGLENLYFFVHQNIELASPLLSAHFIKAINAELKSNLTIPVMQAPKSIE